MSNWNPVWSVTIDGDSYSEHTLNSITITNGRLNIDQQSTPATASLELINFNNTPYNFDVNAPISITLEDSNGVAVPLFTGVISDLAVSVKSTGSSKTVTSATISALGVISILSRNFWASNYSQDTEGDIIDLILDSASGITKGEIDIPGQYQIEQRNAALVPIYEIISLIANSAQGYVWESGDGKINYWDADHRRNYLTTNGYKYFSANDAIGRQVRTVNRLSDIVNVTYLNYGPNYGQQKTAFNSGSQLLYGTYEETINTVLHNATEAQDAAVRRVTLRAFPRPYLDQLSFPLGNPNLTNTERNELIRIFVGMPVAISNLPANIASGQFLGFVERFTFTGSQGNVMLTFQASQSIFSIPPQDWDDVLTPALEWEDVDPALTWIDLAETDL